MRAVASFESFDGVVIAYYTWGADDPARPPVVLHHGFAVNANLNWVMPGVVDALVAAGRQVYALDARGHGESGKPYDPASYGERAMSSDLRLLARRGRIGTFYGLRRTAERRLRRLLTSPFNRFAACSGALLHRVPRRLRAS